MHSRNYYDQETGNHYNYFRDYDPAIGRYVQSDPIGLDGGLNTYGYVDGNPYQFADFEGLRPSMGTDPDPQYRWHPEPGDKVPGRVDGQCLIICVAIKMAIGTAVGHDLEKIGPLSRNKWFGFGPRWVRAMIGRGGGGISLIVKGFGKTPPGMLIGLGGTMKVCDETCKEPPYSCQVPFISRLNSQFMGFPPLPNSGP